MTVIETLNKLIDDHKKYLNGEQSLLKSYELSNGVKLELLKNNTVVKYKAIKNNKLISIITLDGIERTPEQRKAEVEKVFRALFSFRSNEVMYAVHPKQYKLHQ